MRSLLRKGYKACPWRIAYRTGSAVSRNKPLNILHDFYIPVLERSVCYDRMGGYFGPASLAAASQGFSAFFANKGKARFVVYADKKPETGNRKIEDELNAELDHPGSWSENVRNGVQLLGSLVREGILDIRVAFRIHVQSGECLSADTVADGYIREKLGIFTDVLGNRIYISGALNESRTALAVNTESIDVHCDWKEETEYLRVQEAAQSFEILWNDRNPAFRVRILPEAVRKRLVKIADTAKHPREIDGSRPVFSEVASPSPTELLGFAFIKDGPRLPGGRFTGMETSLVAPWPHQEIVAKRLISTWPFSYLLCDEVGLGKTIEAGLVIRSLYLSGLVRRVLIAAPASLTKQWQREMSGKFLMPFACALGGMPPRHEVLLPFKSQASSASLYSPNLSIISTGLLVRPGHKKALKLAENFDLVLVDEAHYARQTNSTRGYRAAPRFNRLYKIISEQLRAKTKCLLLATATPMQLHSSEVFNLIRLTWRAGAFQESPGLANFYYDILGRLIRGMPLSEEEWSFFRKAMSDVERHDPNYYAYLRDTVTDGRIRTSVRRWLEHRRTPRDRELKGIQRLIFSGAPLSRVMLRHSRSLLEIYQGKHRLNANLAERIILPLPKITFTDQEQICYDQLEAYCRKLSHEIIHNGDKKQQISLGFYLSFLRLRFASGLFAIRRTLERRQDRVQSTLEFLSGKNFFFRSRTLACKRGDQGQQPDMEDIPEESDDGAEIVGKLLQHRNKEDLIWEYEHLSFMLDTLSDLSGRSSKMTALLGILDKRRLSGPGRIRQTVIFTRFYDTLTDIVERLRRIDPNMRISTFSGQGGQISDFQNFKDSGYPELISTDREEVRRGFLNKETDILVCTDAAAEGLNLQTADLLINFDLPWNPMKVEQRIGRIDRIGQTHEKVYVCNLCYAGSAEEIVYGRLLSRLARAGDIVGIQQMSLLPVTRDDFKNLAEGKLSEAELEKKPEKRQIWYKSSLHAEKFPLRNFTIFIFGSEERVRRTETHPPSRLIRSGRFCPVHHICAISGVRCSLIKVKKP